jgi:hypothetical protein
VTETAASLIIERIFPPEGRWQWLRATASAVVRNSTSPITHSHAPAPAG